MAYVYTHHRSVLCVKGPMCLGVTDLMTLLTDLIHTQVLVLVWKNNMRGKWKSCQQRISCVSLSGGRCTLGSVFELLWSIHGVQNRIQLILLSYQHHSACFHSRSLKSYIFQKLYYFSTQVSLQATYKERLGPKKLNVWKGVVWRENRRGGCVIMDPTRVLDKKPLRRIPSARIR